MTMQPFSPFLPTTQNIPQEEESFNYFLNDQFARLADVINDKTIGIFSTSEQQNGEKWLYGSTTVQVKKIRNGLQTIIFIPSLITESIPNPVQNIDDNFIMTFAYGTASRLKTSTVTGSYFSFMGDGDSRVQLDITDTFVNIATNGTVSAYQAFIVMEYIKSGN